VHQTDSKFAVRSRRVVTPQAVAEATVLIADGTIIDLLFGSSEAPAGFAVEDCGDAVIMPGLVDSHVHVNEPGRTEWEGFETATRAAAAGGITTIADMPLNSNPVTTTYDALQKKLASTQGKLAVDCAFWGGVIPGNSGSLEEMIDAGVRGFKCFLIHSGIDDFPNATEADLRKAMPILAKRGIPLLVHAELECGESSHWEGEHGSYKSFVQSRPRRWENEAIKLMISLCREFNCPVHIVHLSSSEAIPLIQQAKKEGLPFTTETCPHYLTFAAEEIADGDPRFKCAPPIRERENREKLWQAVQDGTIDFIVSDHSPCTPELKFLSQGDLKKAWGGISSLQFGLSVIWTEGQKRGATLNDLARWMCENPAKFLHLDHSKGRLLPGFDADFIVFDPEAPQTIEQSGIHHRHKVTPYDGRNLSGLVERTYLRGEKIFDRGEFSPPRGRQILVETKAGKKWKEVSI